MEVNIVHLLMVVLMTVITNADGQLCRTETYEAPVQLIDNIDNNNNHDMVTEPALDDNYDYGIAPELSLPPPLPRSLYSLTTCEFLTPSLISLNQRFYQGPHDHYLIITNSNITTIPPSAFIDCCNTVKRLAMNAVSIVNIEPGAFNGLQHLSNLSLNHNEIETITRGILNSLNNLEILDLSYNRIDMIEAKSLTGLNRLTTILLNDNDLINLETNLFEDLKHLKVLDVSNNLLKQIDLRFSNLERLNIADNQLGLFEINLTQLPVRHVNLSNNQIANIDLSLLPQLNQLDLSNNNLENMKNWSNFNCNDINLNYNQLEYIGEINEYTIIFEANHNNLTNLESMISHIDRNHTRNLRVFDVSFNEIKKLDQNLLIGFINLSKLYLQHNQINKIESGCFRYLNKLIILDLSSNQLNYLPYGIFDQLIHLKTLNLSHNYLTNFNYYSLNSLNYLKQLYLDHNLIKSFNGNDLSLYLTNLKQISLDGNKFYCKDLAKLFHILNIARITIRSGTTFNRENVKGISCYADFNNNDDNTSDFSNSSFYRFFQFDFQKSNFVKFFKNFNNNINNNTNEPIGKVANFDYLYGNRINNDGNNYRRDPVIVGVLVFFAITVFLLTINVYITKRRHTCNERMINC